MDKEITSLQVKHLNSVCVDNNNFVHFTGSSVVHNRPCSPLELCDHEESDTRLCVHIKDTLEKGCRKVYLRTVDTDVILIIAGFFFKLLADYPGLDLWVGFGMGKYFQQIHVNTLCERLGELKCTDLATIFSFLLVVTEPLSFIGKGKSQLGRLGNHIQVLLKYLSLLVGHPFQHLEDCSSTIQLLEHCFI